MFGGKFAPVGWLMCDGSALSIADNQVLFAVIGTTYGGDGQTTFALPDMRGRVPLQRSPTYPLGARGGTEQVTLNQQNLAAHTHLANAKSGNGTSAVPAGHYWSSNADYTLYGTTPPDKQFAASAIGSAGGSQPHDNMMPFLTLTFIIAVVGIFPNSRN
jgi:microcystin-dependent protein